MRVLDNLSTGKRENLAHLGDRVELIVGDVRDADCVAQAMTSVQVVFHEAAMVSVPLSVEKPLECHEICATGTLRVLDAARAAGVRRLVFAGSASAYGDAAQCPTTESCLLSPQSPYAAAKLAAEHYCSAYSANTPLETVRLRYFNVFGPRQDPTSPYSGVISIFCDKLLAGQQPTIFGDGLQSRDFVSVANIVRANRLAAQTPGVDGRVFNIGAGGRISLLELLQALNALLGTAIEPTFGPVRAGDVRHSQADITAARTGLGYEPSTTFQQGLAECLEHFKTGR